MVSCSSGSVDERQCRVGLDSVFLLVVGPTVFRSSYSSTWAIIVFEPAAGFRKQTLAVYALSEFVAVGAQRGGGSSVLPSDFVASLVINR